MVRLWSGLGYNRRALNLHRAAATVVADARRERAARTTRRCARCAGVGPYTARAVRSFAFGEDVAAVDTNAVRVLARAAWRARRSRLRAAMALGDRLVPAGAVVGVQPDHVRPRGDRVHGRGDRTARRAPLRRQCAWRRAGGAGPDPWRGSPTARPQSAFAGSDRQGRGRLLEALRRGGVPAARLAGGLRLARRPGRAERVAAALVDEGFARWSGGKRPVLRLR